MQANDAEEFGSICNEPGVRRYLFDDEAVAPALIREILARSASDFETRGFGLWILQEKLSERTIGFCGLRVVFELDEVEILYALSESWWRRGYALEAAQTVMRYAFDVVDLARVIGVVDAPNHASWRVLDKLVMTEFRPATDRQHLRYAMATRGK